MVSKIEIAYNLTRAALATIAALILLSGTAWAQLALSGNPPVAGTAIPFGATGLTSPGLSPAPAGTIGPTGNGATCSAAGSSSSGMSGTGTGMAGTSTNYDGGGLELGTALQGTSPICGTSSGGPGSTATLALPPSPGGASPAGIPLGSFEINNAGVSPSVVVPAPSISMPITTSPPTPTVGASMPCSMTGSSIPIGC
jgi:hypothetical protein